MAVDDPDEERDPDVERRFSDAREQLHEVLSAELAGYDAAEADRAVDAWAESADDGE